jgi:outer membrane biosynthesis protein TonB
LLFFYKTYDSKLLLQVSSVKSEAVVQFVSFMQQKPSVKTIAHKPAVVKTKVHQPAQLVKTITQKTVPKAVQKKVENQPGVKKQEKTKLPVKEKKKEPVAQKEVQKQPATKEQVKQVDKKDLPTQGLKKEETQSLAPVEKPIQKISKQEFDALSLQASLQEAVGQVWAPPAGMDEKLVCQVSFTVDWNGKLIEHFVTESSGILVFDIAVEQAVAELSVPRQLWGKSVTVAFKP